MSVEDRIIELGGKLSSNSSNNKSNSNLSNVEKRILELGGKVKSSTPTTNTDTKVDKSNSTSLNGIAADNSGSALNTAIQEDKTTEEYGSNLDEQLGKSEDNKSNLEKEVEKQTGFTFRDDQGKIQYKSNETGANMVVNSNPVGNANYLDIILNSQADSKFKTQLANMAVAKYISPELGQNYNISVAQQYANTYLNSALYQTGIPLKRYIEDPIAQKAVNGVMDRLFENGLKTHTLASYKNNLYNAAENAQKKADESKPTMSEDEARLADAYDINGEGKNYLKKHKEDSAKYTQLNYEALTEKYNYYLNDPDNKKYVGDYIGKTNKYNPKADVLNGESPINKVKWAEDNQLTIATYENDENIQPYINLKYMTEEERKVYDITLAKEGEAGADEFLEYLSDSLAYRSFIDNEQTQKDIDSGNISNGIDPSNVVTDTNNKVNVAKLIGGTIVQGADIVVDKIVDYAYMLLGGFAQEIHNILNQTANTFGYTGDKNLFGDENYIERFRDYIHNYSNTNAEIYAKNAEGSKAAQIINKYGTMVMATVPASLLSAMAAVMTGGASLAVTATTESLATAAAIGESSGAAQFAIMAGNAIKQIASNPNTQFSFIQESGSAYESALEDGVSESEAAVYASIYGIAASLVEVGGGDDALGGMQKLPVNIQKAFEKGNNKAILEYAKSIVGEMGEEVVQGMLERGLKSMYTDVPIYSNTNQNALINPSVMGEEAKGAAIVSSILGGGQIALGKSIDAINNKNKEINNAESGLALHKNGSESPMQSGPGESSGSAVHDGSAEVGQPALYAQSNVQNSKGQRKTEGLQSDSDGAEDVQFGKDKEGTGQAGRRIKKIDNAFSDLKPESYHDDPQYDNSDSTAINNKIADSIKNNITGIKEDIKIDIISKSFESIGEKYDSESIDDNFVISNSMSSDGDYYLAKILTGKDWDSLSNEEKTELISKASEINASIRDNLADLGIFTSDQIKAITSAIAGTKEVSTSSGGTMTVPAEAVFNKDGNYWETDSMYFQEKKPYDNSGKYIEKINGFRIYHNEDNDTYLLVDKEGNITGRETGDLFEARKLANNYDNQLKSGGYYGIRRFPLDMPQQFDKDGNLLFGKNDDGVWEINVPLESYKTITKGGSAFSDLAGVNLDTYSGYGITKNAIELSINSDEKNPSTDRNIKLAKGRLDIAMQKGIIVNGVKYVFFDNSPTQQKKGIYMFVPEKEYQDLLRAGHSNLENFEFSNGINTSSELSYISNLMSPSKKTDIKLTDAIVIPDLYGYGEYELRQFERTVSWNPDEDIKEHPEFKMLTDKTRRNKSITLPNGDVIDLSELSGEEYEEVVGNIIKQYEPGTAFLMMSQTLKQQADGLGFFDSKVLNGEEGHKSFQMRGDFGGLKGLLCAVSFDEIKAKLQNDLTLGKTFYYVNEDGTPRPSARYIDEDVGIELMNVFGKWEPLSKFNTILTASQVKNIKNFMIKDENGNIDADKSTEFFYSRVGNSNIRRMNRSNIYGKNPDEEVITGKTKANLVQELRNIGCTKEEADEIVSDNMNDILEKVVKDHSIAAKVIGFNPDSGNEPSGTVEALKLWAYYQQTGNLDILDSAEYREVIRNKLHQMYQNSGGSQLMMNSDEYFWGWIMPDVVGLLNSMFALQGNRYQSSNLTVDERFGRANPVFNYDGFSGLESGEVHIDGTSKKRPNGIKEGKAVLARNPSASDAQHPITKNRITNVVEAYKALGLDTDVIYFNIMNYYNEALDADNDGDTGKIILDPKIVNLFVKSKEAGKTDYWAEFYHGSAEKTYLYYNGKNYSDIGDFAKSMLSKETLELLKNGADRSNFTEKELAIIDYSIRATKTLEANVNNWYGLNIGQIDKYADKLVSTAPSEIVKYLAENGTDEQKELCKKYIEKDPTFARLKSKKVTDPAYTEEPVKEGYNRYNPFKQNKTTTLDPKLELDDIDFSSMSNTEKLEYAEKKANEKYPISIEYKGVKYESLGDLPQDADEKLAITVGDINEHAKYASHIFEEINKLPKKSSKSIFAGLKPSTNQEDEIYKLAKEVYSVQEKMRANAIRILNVAYPLSIDKNKTGLLDKGFEKAVNDVYKFVNGISVTNGYDIETAADFSPKYGADTVSNYYKNSRNTGKQKSYESALANETEHGKKLIMRGGETLSSRMANRIEETGESLDLDIIKKYGSEPSSNMQMDVYSIIPADKYIGISDNVHKAIMEKYNEIVRLADKTARQCAMYNLMESLGLTPIQFESFLCNTLGILDGAKYPNLWQNFNHRNVNPERTDISPAEALQLGIKIVGRQKQIPNIEARINSNIEDIDVIRLSLNEFINQNIEKLINLGSSENDVNRRINISDALAKLNESIRTLKRNTSEDFTDIAETALRQIDALKDISDTVDWDTISIEKSEYDKLVEDMYKVLNELKKDSKTLTSYKSYLDKMLFKYDNLLSSTEFSANRIGFGDITQPTGLEGRLIDFGPDGKPAENSILKAITDFDVNQYRDVGGTRIFEDEDYLSALVLSEEPSLEKVLNNYRQNNQITEITDSGIAESIKPAAPSPVIPSVKPVTIIKPAVVPTETNQEVKKNIESVSEKPEIAKHVISYSPGKEFGLYTGKYESEVTSALSDLSSYKSTTFGTDKYTDLAKNRKLTTTDKSAEHIKNNYDAFIDAFKSIPKNPAACLNIKSLYDNLPVFLKEHDSDYLETILNNLHNAYLNVSKHPENPGNIYEFKTALINASKAVKNHFETIDKAFDGLEYASEILSAIDKEFNGNKPKNAIGKTAAKIKSAKTDFLDAGQFSFPNLLREAAGWDRDNHPFLYELADAIDKANKGIINICGFAQNTLNGIKESKKGNKLLSGRSFSNISELNITDTNGNKVESINNLDLIWLKFVAEEFRNAKEPDKLSKNIILNADGNRTYIQNINILDLADSITFEDGSPEQILLDSIKSFRESMSETDRYEFITRTGIDIDTSKAPIQHEYFLKENGGNNLNNRFKISKIPIKYNADGTESKSGKSSDDSYIVIRPADRAFLALARTEAQYPYINIINSVRIMDTDNPYFDTLSTLMSKTWGKSHGEQLKIAMDDMLKFVHSFDDTTADKMAQALNNALTVKYLFGKPASALKALGSHPLMYALDTSKYDKSKYGMPNNYKDITMGDLIAGNAVMGFIRAKMNPELANRARTQNPLTYRRDFGFDVSTTAGIDISELAGMEKYINESKIIKAARNAYGVVDAVEEQFGHYLGAIYHNVVITNKMDINDPKTLELMDDMFSDVLYYYATTSLYQLQSGFARGSKNSYTKSLTFLGNATTKIWNNKEQYQREYKYGHSENAKKQAIRDSKARLASAFLMGVISTAYDLLTNNSDYWKEEDDKKKFNTPQLIFKLAFNSAMSFFTTAYLSAPVFHVGSQAAISTTNALYKLITKDDSKHLNQASYDYSINSPTDIVIDAFNDGLSVIKQISSGKSALREISNLIYDVMPISGISFEGISKLVNIPATYALKALGVDTMGQKKFIDILDSHIDDYYSTQRAVLRMNTGNEKDNQKIIDKIIAYTSKNTQDYDDKNSYQKLLANKNSIRTIVEKGYYSGEIDETKAKELLNIFDYNDAQIDTILKELGKYGEITTLNGEPIKFGDIKEAYLKDDINISPDKLKEIMVDVGYAPSVVDQKIRDWDFIKKYKEYSFSDLTRENWQYVIEYEGLRNDIPKAISMYQELKDCEEDVARNYIGETVYDSQHAGKKTWAGLKEDFVNGESYANHTYVAEAYNKYFGYSLEDAESMAYAYDEHKAFADNSEEIAKVYAEIDKGLLDRYGKEYENSKLYSGKDAGNYSIDVGENYKDYVDLNNKVKIDYPTYISIKTAFDSGLLSEYKDIEGNTRYYNLTDYIKEKMPNISEKDFTEIVLAMYEYKESIMENILSYFKTGEY